LPSHKGWALVDERTEEGDNLQYQVCLTARIVADELRVEPADHPLADKLAAEYDHLLRVWDGGIVSSWMSEMTRNFHAVPLRERGGIYFIPKTDLPEYKRRIAVLNAVSDCRVYEIPAMHSDDAIEAILAAVLAQADGEIAEMDSELEADEIGVRAIRTRETRCESLMEHVQLYEGLLGRNLDALKKRVDDLKAQLVQAALAKEAEAQKEEDKANAA
jgi:hypothetical protein